MSTLTHSEEEIVQTAIKEMMTQLKGPSGTPSNIYAHGPGGLLSPAGLSRGLANAMILPSLGLASMLPMRPSMEENPLHGIFTGVTADTGDEPADRCSDPPVAGSSKLCTHTFVYGWVGRKSRELRLDRFGSITNRGEFTDFSVIGNPFMGPDVPQVPVPGGAVTPDMVNTEVGKLLFELAVSLLRTQAADTFTGDPANNSGATGSSGREYFYGLDTLINTGYRDAITAQACPAADSIVRDWNNVDIADDSTGIVREITYIFRNLMYISQKAGLDPTQWVLAMRWGAFYELTEIWPCAYLSYRCNLTGNSTNFIDAGAQTEMRDAMRDAGNNGRNPYLLIDGMRIPVTISDAITEDSPAIAGQYSSDIYFVPLTVRGQGGTPLSEGGGLATYFEYFNMNAPNGPMAGARALAPTGAYESTGNGRYLFHKYYPENMCVQIAGWTKPRLIMETPYLAARLQNVAYTPLIHEREAFTDDAYFVDGGRTDFLGYGPSYYSPTS